MRENRCRFKARQRGENDDADDARRVAHEAAKQPRGFEVVDGARGENRAEKRGDHSDLGAATCERRGHGRFVEGRIKLFLSGVQVSEGAAPLPLYSKDISVVEGKK